MFIKIKMYANDGLTNLGLSKIQVLDNSKSAIAFTIDKLVSHTFNYNNSSSYFVSWLNNNKPSSIPYQSSNQGEFVLSVPNNPENKYTLNLYNWINTTGLIKRVEISFSQNGSVYYEPEIYNLDLNLESLTVIDYITIRKYTNLALKNPTTNQHYSLAEKTLIPLPDTSSKNMILHGIEAGTEIRLDEAFDKIQYLVDVSGLGQNLEDRVVIKDVNGKIKKIILK